MLNWIKTIFSKDPIKEFEKKSAEELRRKGREIDYEIENMMAEAHIKEEELARLVERGSNASEIEVDAIAEQCAMIEEEIKAIKDVAHTLVSIGYSAKEFEWQHRHYC
ncbi:MAG TPA: hypothetical protein EYP22_03580 [Methanosarcinales archaeon]|nr:hypothetical protein [Methanosarcinales archaeon]